MAINLTINIDFDNLLVVVMTTISALFGIIGAVAAVVAARYGIRLFNRGLPRYETIEWHQRDGGEIEFFLNVWHNLPTCITINKKRIMGRKEEHYDCRAKDLKADHKERISIKVPIRKEDVEKVSFSFKETKQDEYVIIV